MDKSISQSRRQLLLSVAAAALLAGCADEAPLAPATEAALPAQFTVGACGNLEVEAGNEVAFHTYATGVQIYRWNGTSWSFVGPVATLSADARGRGNVGIHYAGPTWESVSGSKVVGTVLQRCTPDPAAIPWLLLGAVASAGPGVFNGVTFIQRVNTAGGNAPASAGTFVGEEARVAYTAEYYFYKAE